MTLVGLTSLLVGGIGVANGIRAWLEARARSIATLRCLGASADLVFAVVLIQVMALAALGVVLGAAIGAALPVAASGLLRDVLPVPPILGVFPRPLGLGRAVRTAHGGRLFAVAAGASDADLRRSLVPRCAAAGPGAAAGGPAVGERAARRGAGGADRGHRRRSQIRRLVLRGRHRDAGAVPRRRMGDGPARGDRPAWRKPGGPSRPVQPAPPGQHHRR